MAFGPFKVRVLYNDSQDRWILAPSDETVRSRSAYRTKQAAMDVARQVAKRHNGTLEVYTRDGGLQNTFDYTSNSSGSKKPSGGLFDNFF